MPARTQSRIHSAQAKLSFGRLSYCLGVLLEVEWDCNSMVGVFILLSSFCSVSPCVPRLRFGLSSLLVCALPRWDTALILYIIARVTPKINHYRTVPSLRYEYRSIVTTLLCY